MFRINKLLAESFENLYEPIIVESPFTQVTESGIGIRQYEIALTRTKIIFACDDFEFVDMENFGYHTQSPEVETLALVSFMPLQELKIHFYRYNQRKIMRIAIKGEEGRPMFFEIGGLIYQTLLWNIFREQISCLHLMTPELFSITGESPFASTDVLEDKIVCEAIVHNNAEDSSATNLTCRGYQTT